MLFFSPLFFLQMFASFVLFRFHVHRMKGKNDHGSGYILHEVGIAIHFFGSCIESSGASIIINNKT